MSSSHSPTYRSVDVSTGRVIRTYPFCSDEDISAALARAHGAYTRWSAMTFGERAEIIARVAELFTDRQDELGQLISLEMGKPAAEAPGEAEFSGGIFRYYALHAEDFCKDVVIEDSASSRSVIQSRSLGALLGIMPWNYPYYQVARFAAPNLMLGNTIILKHAESVPQSALAIEELMKDAGVPDGVYSNIFATHEQTSTCISDPRIRGVSLTGSERAGAAIAAQAGKSLKKVVLELGGSDPYVILSSSNLLESAREAVATRLENTGQACNSNKRIIVHADIYDAFVDEIVKIVGSLRPAAPDAISDVLSNFGPLSSEAAAEKITQQVSRAADSGAQVHTGGIRLPNEFASGFYVSPAVITDIPVGSPVYYEEFFGPVIQIYRVSSDEEALKVANDSQYGLGATVFATEIGRAEGFAENLEAGMVGINHRAPETENMPFGGIKNSGYGRELGPLGIDEFVNKKLVSIRKSA